MSYRSAFIVPLFMLVAATPAWAQSGAPNANTTATGAAGAHTAQDVRFVTAASAGGMTEVMASRLAEKQSTSDKIKSFADTMIRDHGKANDQLKTLAQQGGYTLSSMPTSAQEAGLAKLRSLHGAAFDKAYSAMMVKDHRQAVALFQSESTSGSDSNIKGFAAQTLPILQHHLALANAL